MKMRKTGILKSIVCILSLSATAGLVSCTEDYMTYDTGYSGIYFTNDTMRYSFGVTTVDIRETEYHIPVYLMGEPSGTDRSFAYAVEAGGTTAEEGKQFATGASVLKADSIRGYIPVKIFRDELEGNYQDGYVRYKVAIRLKADETFTPTLGGKQQVCVLVFDNAVEQPNWLDYKGDKVWTEKDFGKWHPLKFIKMVEFFHTVEDVLPESYKNMVAEYGENLEHVEFGSFYKYNTIMTKYVFYPMYEYFSNPANEDEILSLYPDFPRGDDGKFDFPNPYE